MNSIVFRHLLYGFILGLFGLSSSVASASEDLDVTMRMVTEDETLTDSVVREIRLDHPINLEPGSDRGRNIAREAREDGRAFGEAVAEQAREAAQNRQARTPPEQPDRPEKPEKPENQGPDGPSGPPDGVPGGAVR